MELLMLGCVLSDKLCCGACITVCKNEQSDFHYNPRFLLVSSVASKCWDSG